MHLLLFCAKGPNGATVEAERKCCIFFHETLKGLDSVLEHGGAVVADGGTTAWENDLPVGCKRHTTALFLEEADQARRSRAQVGYTGSGSGGC